jgi:hypothetical protein
LTIPIAKYSHFINVCRVRSSAFAVAWETQPQTTLQRIVKRSTKPPAMLEESRCFTYAEDLPECFDRSKHYQGDLPCRQTGAALGRTVK